MASKLYAGKGTLIQASADGVSWTKLNQIRKLDHSGSKATMDSGYNFDSPSGYDEVLPVKLEGGDWTGDGLLNPSDPSAIQLNLWLNNFTYLYFKHTYIDGTVDTYNGYVTELKMVTVEPAKINTFSFKFSVTGPITRTAATSSAPTITSLNPSSSHSGNPVEIAGTNFLGVQGAGSVTVNGVTATVKDWSDTDIIILCPATTSGNVVVTNAQANSSAGTHTLTIS